MASASEQCAAGFSGYKILANSNLFYAKERGLMVGIAKVGSLTASRSSILARALTALLPGLSFATL